MAVEVEGVVDDDDDDDVVPDVEYNVVLDGCGVVQLGGVVEPAVLVLDKDV